MPIHYVCMLNKQNKVVLSASFEKQQFKQQIEENKGVIKLYQIIKFDFSEQIKFIYRNLGYITCAIVIENDVLKQEISEFFDEVIDHIDCYILGRCLYKAPGLDGSLEAADGKQRTTARD